MTISVALMIVQVFFAIVIGLYFWNLLRNQQTSKTAVDREAKKEMEKLHRLRAISLTQPLAEKTRPAALSDIIGQKEGLRALKAALCGPNPQHVIIYGPPGVGKTAAARVIMEEAKKNPDSPFKRNAKFLEIDATTARFDERGIADPLIGSVHDPIYQGAGALGVAGIPQPKAGAVTKAHGGILFIDEIGELHPTQMNKLLKVLEDRKVFLESSYYNSEDPHIPGHIHDIFQNGLPADFRLVGATTRSPQQIPAAIRSRCMEIFFRPLLPEEISVIADKAMEKLGFKDCQAAVDIVVKYAGNGREAVNMIQLAAGLAITEGREKIAAADIEWVAHSCQLSPRPLPQIPLSPQIGLVNGLAVYGPNLGSLLEVEVTAIPAAASGKGTINITGVVEEEEMADSSRTVRRKSMARSSMENVLTVLRKFNVRVRDYDLHINFPGGVPVDGPSAGIAIAIAIVSAIRREPVDNKIAMTGEVSIHGKIKPVGGITAKIEAALHAGVTRVMIPKENWQSVFQEMQGIEVIGVETVEEALHIVLGRQIVLSEQKSAAAEPAVPVALPVLQAEATQR